MLYLYDKAICDDLQRSFNSEVAGNPVVRAIEPEGLLQLAAQIQNDEITFPCISVVRSKTYEIDTNRSNFTWMHRGVAKVVDLNTNNLYYERAIPITLSYTLNILTTNTADRDELVRELIFKYVSMYFLTIQLPYEADRKMRFGVIIDAENIENNSGSLEGMTSGTLYETLIPLKVEGAVLLNYTPVKLKRAEYSVDPNAKQG